MLVSIVIPARNEDPAVLDATLAGIERTTRHLPVEVIVVDDGSNVPVTCGQRRVTVLRHWQPLGASGARHSGTALAHGDVLVFVDAHMSFGDHWLEQILLQIHHDALLCSPYWTYDLKDCLCWGADFQWNTTRDYAAQQYPGLGWRHRTEPQSHPLVEVPLLIGACYAMRREVYDRMGGYSPHLRIWGVEEQDLSARAWMAGFSVACATQVKVGHLVRNAFPYPVLFDHLEFNQLVVIRGLFERETIEVLERDFEPIPDEVTAWLAETDLSRWRAAIQRRRKMTDAVFFARFLPDVAARLKGKRHATKRRP
jgi:glycosyltransferase involved in cell wall biosynthesis